jgi:hypothetical protein
MLGLFYCQIEPAFAGRQACRNLILYPKTDSDNLLA